MEDTREQLVRIMEMYNIGKKPLSRLLGWGETTVLNQLKGATPGREMAGKIREISEDPYLFSDILEQNREKITEVAYKKARRALDEKLLRDKAANIINYLVAGVNCDTAPYQLVAALFYSQAASLVLNGKPLIDEDIVYRPGNHMPYPGIYEDLLKEGLHLVKHPEDSLSPEDRNLVRAIHKLLNGYSPNAVKTLLMEDKAALLARHSADEAENTGEIMISLSEFQAYCLDQNVGLMVTDIKGFRKYFDEKLKKSRNKKQRTGYGD